MSGAKANNTLYFKAFNEDYRVGGIYHSLDSSELRMMVIMQSYADGYGFVRRNSGKGYSAKELTEMLGVNYRTVKRSLMTLQDKGLLMVDDSMGILLKRFVYDGAEREKTHSAARIRLAKTNQVVMKKQDEIISRLDNAGILNKETGEFQ